MSLSDTPTLDYSECFALTDGEGCYFKKLELVKISLLPV